jgi:replicative DNA helicase
MITLENIEGEAAILGAMFFNNQLIDHVADILTPLDFYEPLHTRIYEAILRQASMGKHASPITIKSYFEGDEGLKAVGGWSYLANLSANENGALAPLDLARYLRDLSDRRQMHEGLSMAASACLDMDATPAEIVGHADAALAGRSQDSVKSISIGNCFDTLVNGFGQPVSGVMCQTIPTLDNLLGHMRPKQLIIGAGRPGMGKTALALSYALGAAETGHGVLFVSLEMSSGELVTRAASCASFNGESGVPYGFIRDDSLTDGQRRRIAEIGHGMKSIPLSIVDTAGLTVGRLAMLVRRQARKMAANGTKLELVIVDYLQLLHADRRNLGRYEAISEVSQALKEIAKLNDVAVFALAQLSRSVEGRPDKRPQLSDLKDSGQIEQDADAVLFLLRPEYYLMQAEPERLSPDRLGWETAMDEAKGKIELILAKRRNGETGSAFAQFHGAYQAVMG